MKIKIEEVWGELKNNIEVVLANLSYEKKDEGFTLKLEHFINNFSPVALEDNIEMLMIQVHNIRLITNIIENENYLEPRKYNDWEKAMIGRINEDFQLLSNVIRNRVSELIKIVEKKAEQEEKENNKKRLPNLEDDEEPEVKDRLSYE